MVGFIFFQRNIENIYQGGKVNLARLAIYLPIPNSILTSFPIMFNFFFCS